MKNNKIIIHSILVTGILILSVKSGWCISGDSVDAIQQGVSALPADMTMKTGTTALSILKKFAITMGSVLVSLIVIWFGLNILKKFKLNNRSHSKDLYNDGLSSPKTVDEAIAFFINKNRLK